MSNDTVLPILLIMAVILSGIYAGNYDAGKEFSGSNDGGSLIYLNQEFGFKFYLPAAWQGYSVLETVWEGHGVDGELQGKIAASGPQFLLRHPLWTQEVPRQVIPIMVFTLDQWESMQQGRFHIGAAPIGPSELGRNNGYVFALPARYNFAFPAGFEEVEQILAAKPLLAFDI